MARVDPEQLLSGNRRALAKAITLIESRLESDRNAATELLDRILAHTGGSLRIGITGVPGVGKSTFIEAFGLYLIEQGHRVAVLAVDPSSPVAGGSILGDKTRMEKLSRHPDAYIRPSPSSGALGGVAQKTRESLLVCEAAGYDIVLIETVGVGQSEFQVAGMVDFFMVLLLPNAGDDLQGMKKGIMELADGLVINKADGDSLAMARQTRVYYQNALQLIRHPDFWAPRVLTCSARDGDHIEDVWQMLLDYRKAALDSGEFDGRRARQNRDWMHRLLHEMLEQKLVENPEIRRLIPRLEEDVIGGRTTPLSAAKTLIDMM